MALSRYFEQYGGTEADLGAIPVTIRTHASLNPNAIMRSRYTLDEYLDCRYIARPLRLYDYCLINDGCVAYIITSRERAAISSSLRSSSPVLLSERTFGSGTSLRTSGSRHVPR